ncbi:hypothetical protein [uncultured Methylobacterium sp.]|uniref:hypothetical protein n=1 Tax=uncultured Methylobacterium sp. TaxID=157278 RepID=UPI0035CA027E
MTISDNQYCLEDPTCELLDTRRRPCDEPYRKLAEAHVREYTRLGLSSITAQRIG